jgi:hypothetical protein
MGLTKRTAEKPTQSSRADDEGVTDKMDDVTVGRDLLQDYRRQSEAVVDTLVEGQGVQFYDNGWRYGTVDSLPAADEKRYGQVRILHPTTGTIWIAGRDVRPLEA